MKKFRRIRIRRRRRNSRRELPEKKRSFFFEDQHAPPEAQPFFTPTPVQAKLTVSRPGDKDEKEADAVADQVVQKETTDIKRKTPDPLPPSGGGGQRPGEEKELQPKKEEMQRQPIQEEEEELQTQAEEEEEELQTQAEEEEEELQTQAEEEEEEIQASASTSKPTVGPQLSRQIKASQGSGKPLPGKTRAEMESAFGRDLKKVQIHTDDKAARFNRSIKARAFTLGADIYFNSGEFDPQSSGGKHLLAHELTHVVQQKGDKLQKKEGEEGKSGSPAAAHEAPVENRYNYVFIMGSEGSYRYADWFADTYYAGYAKKHPGSLCNLLDIIYQDVGFKTAGETRNGIGRVVIVTHAREDGTFFFPMNDDSEQKWIQAEEAARIMSDDWMEKAGIACKIAGRNVAQAADAGTMVTIKGCNIGKNGAALDAIRELFGGEATVKGFKKTFHMGVKGFGEGKTSDAGSNAIEVIDFMVTNGYLPVAAKNWPDETKESFVVDLFKSEISPITGIPFDAVVVEGGKLALPSDPGFQEAVAESKPEE